MELQIGVCKHGLSNAESKLVKCRGVGLHKWRRKNAHVKIKLVTENTGKQKPTGCLEGQSKDMPASLVSCDAKAVAFCMRLSMGAA